MLIKITRYYLTCQEDFGSNNIIPIKDPSGKVLALMDPMCYASFALEGSGKLSTGATLNVTGTYLDCTPEIAKSLLYVATKFYRGKKSLVGLSMDATKYLAFSKVDAPYGLGNKGNKLIPFVSVAADQKIHKFGSQFFCQALSGLMLPNGVIHNGILRVDDVGGSIKGELRLDWFVGKKRWFVKEIPDEVEMKKV